MKYVYVNSKRMEYIKQQLNALSYCGNETLTNDILVLPFIDDELTKILETRKIYNCDIFVPFITTIFDVSNRVHPYMEDVEVVRRNADLTAIGLFIYMNTLALSNMTTVDIIGSGVCANATYQLFNMLNIEVRLISRSDKKGYIPLARYKNIKKSELIINTAIKYVDIGNLEGCTTIIDISTNRVIPKKDKVNVIYPGSLPNRYTPYSSAIIITDFIGNIYGK